MSGRKLFEVVLVKKEGTETKSRKVYVVADDMLRAAHELKDCTSEHEHILSATLISDECFVHVDKV